LVSRQLSSVSWEQAVGSFTSTSIQAVEVLVVVEGSLLPVAKAVYNMLLEPRSLWLQRPFTLSMVADR
jgi:hypothetical protein